MMPLVKEQLYGVTSYLSDSIVYDAPSDASTLQLSSLRHHMTKESSNFLIEKCASAYILPKKNKNKIKKHVEASF
jgi:hypothetical protein